MHVSARGHFACVFVCLSVQRKEMNTRKQTAAISCPQQCAEFRLFSSEQAQCGYFHQNRQCGYVHQHRHSVAVYISTVRVWLFPSKQAQRGYFHQQRHSVAISISTDSAAISISTGIVWLFTSAQTVRLFPSAQAHQLTHPNGEAVV